LAYVIKRYRLPCLAALATTVAAIGTLAVTATATATVTATASVNAGASHTARASAAGSPAADCQPYSGQPCLFPFPDNRLTRPDKSSATGVRVNLPAGGMPVNVKGVPIAPGPYDRNDGFAPGSAIILHVPGLDNQQALTRTAAAPLLNMSRAFAKRQPIVVIDEATGQRQLIWAELDVNATTPANTDLLIHPGKDFADGHTYIVALRDLRTASGKLIAAPKWFRLLRAGGRLPATERSQAKRYAHIFAALKRARITRDKTLYEAWNFTVGSEQNLTGRMLAIRNNAFAQLGDKNLADGVVKGHAPAFNVTSVTPLPTSSGVSGTFTSVQGTFQVPCYLVVCGASATAGFHYSSSKPDATPTQIPGNMATAPFECIIPSTASATNPARISLYGHGLLGSHDEVEDSWVQALASGHNMVFCATDWWGLAEGDVAGDINALQNLNGFSNVTDRLQQGVLNTLFLGRLLLNPKGFASNGAFQSGGKSLIDTSHLYYDGNSQGGIMGGMLTAVAPDFRHAVLGVTGLDYGGLLLQRSTDFADYSSFLYPSYPDQSEHPLILDLMQQLWDRGEADAYAQYMTTHPLPDTPTHQVLMQIAYGDHQVSMYAGAQEARTVGASVYEPALDLNTNRGRDRNLFYGLPAIKKFPFNGSAIEIWDSGPGHTQPPPLGNVAPPETNNPPFLDPHEDPRKTPLAQEQMSDFLEPNGPIVNVCGGKPCHTSVYMP
jgi:hypothetical protein